MKKFKILLLIVSILLVSGCGTTKESITESEFIEIAQNQGLTTYDDSASFDYVESAYVAAIKDLKVIYIKGKKKADIEGTFIDQCNNIYKRALEGYKDSKKSGSNWSTLKITDSDHYYFISLIDDTYIYIEGSIEKKDKIINQLNNLITC